MILYQIRLSKKKYYSSDSYKLLQMNYNELIKFLCNDQAKINFQTNELSIFVDNEKKIINVER